MPDPPTWRQAIDVAASGDPRTVRSAREYLDGVRTRIEEIRGAIVPPRSSRFTLGGRHSTIRFTLPNNGPVELRVRVIISSDKLEIDDEDENREIVLAPGESQERDGAGGEPARTASSRSTSRS